MYLNAEAAPLVPRTFADAARIYLDWYRAEHSDRPSTWRRVLVSFTALRTVFGRRPLQAIAASDLEEYKFRRRHYVKAVTIRHDLHALSGLYQFGIRQQWCAENLVRQITIPSDRDAVRIRVLTLEEQSTYLKASQSQPTLHAVAQMILATGMRPGELLALRASDFDRRDRRIIVRGGKTAAARRSIRLKPDMENLVSRLVEGKRHQDYLFPGKLPNTPLTTLAGPHRRACVRAGLEFCIYDLRHTFASRVAAKGMPLTTLAAILGHSSLRCVLRYIHPQQTAMDDAIELFS